MSGKKPQKPKHTDKQAMFIKEYIVDLNGTQAAIRAGYSEDTARQIANQLLSKLDIRDAINEEIKKRAKRVEFTQDQVIYELIKMASADIGEYLDEDGKIDLSKINSYNSAIIKEIVTDKTETDKGDLHTEKERVSLKLHDKLKAVELLGRHLALFTDKQEIGGSDGGAIQSEIKIRLIDGNKGPDEA